MAERNPARQTPTEAWTELEAGNSRFAAGHGQHTGPHTVRRLELLGEQRPFALIVGCSDSRVPAEIVFDQGLGELFVVRTAGHVSDNAVLGSVEFGVGELHIPLVLVLGHQSCGAVTAAVQAVDQDYLPAGYVRELVERISLSVVAAHRKKLETVDDVIAEHVRHTAELISQRSAVVAAAIDAEHTAILGAVYDLSTGRVNDVHRIGHV